MLQIKDAAALFLKDSAQRGLDETELTIVTMLAEGKSCRQIAAHMEIDLLVAQRFGNKMKNTVLREERAKKAPERLESLIAALKASKKSLYEIPVHGLLIGRFEDALYRAGISRLGDAADKGRARLLAIINFGESGVDAIEKILARFDGKLRA